ncbi:Pentatricopeptide repeat-containing protein [Acorus gramineus]|uniref:Pentatricopeptide repeat-containing protein n=1 Tax=Acorus gramineus TaxID=55184 RepID=A0AAV9ANQ8_ACOGR|nr:Pentatricopeptide repeat-containing protein [Acorus gramineus]
MEELVAEMEQYTCVVDLLGRVGRLDEVMRFIEDMPNELSVMVWETLQGACRIHSDVELGEIAAKKILMVRQNYSATYVLLSNAYIEKGSLKDGMSMRSSMRERGVKKEPGFSWIVVVGDKKHLEEEIYGVLDALEEEMIGIRILDPMFV